MFRLALNVSATRLVLLDGFAGKVIESFGHFVVGGSLVVGLVIFLILVVIQFVVITNGAGRVAEVAARFTLDAMPGKQMAIDADLNSGLIDEDEARRRRAEVSQEADFYGAMDGASKFVKGDAIAAIVITLVNLFGGFFVGVVQRHQSMGDAISTYSLLSIGDGLVSQIPALLISISTGLIVTRATTDGDMGSDLLKQFGAQRRAVQIAGSAIIALAMIPGLPKLPFLLVGGAVLVIAQRLPKQDDGSKATPEAVAALAAAPSPDSPESIARDMRVEPLELELAYDLIDLVDALDRRRPARPGARPAAQARARARHRHPAGAHPRQPRPAADDLRHPPARRRGGPRRGPGRDAARHRRRPRVAAGHGHQGAGLRPGRQVGAGRDAPARRPGRRHRGGPRPRW